MPTNTQWMFNLATSSPSLSQLSHHDSELSDPRTGNLKTTAPFVCISVAKHTSALSFLTTHSFTDSSPGLLEVGVNVRSDVIAHEIRVELPAESRPGLAASVTLISAFRKSNQLNVHADLYEFRIKFSPREVDVAAAKAMIDKDGVLILHVQRLGGWLYRL